MTLRTPKVQLPLPIRMQRRGNSLDGIAERVEGRMGKIPLSGRYHRAPHKIENDYQISQQVLGTGYNGEVRLATRPHTSQKFAVKVFSLANLASNKLEQLKAEVENFLSMDHPHITRLYDVYESKNQLHLVMECMEGGELFDRVTKLKRFPEEDAAGAMWQMLLALNYIHSHGIVHRDLKLENFLYDKPGSNHLKLIDFGFSKMWDPSVKMQVSCGSLAYVAPEVLLRSYTSQCDMWSLGVVGFILLSGYMPFSGPEATQSQNILSGRYTLRPEKWSKVSPTGVEFMQSLLEVDPQKRLTAQGALEHLWFQQWQREPKQVDVGVVKALHQFSQASKFRRCCMEMIAWSLSNEERAKVREYFISMDTNRTGTISFAELKSAFADTLGIADDEVRRVFATLDYNHDQEIHYSDFLAAMVSTKIDLNDELMCSAFRKFDTDSSGYITVENLREVLGDTFEGERVEALLREADQHEDHRISYPEFVAYLQGNSIGTSSPPSSESDEGASHKTHSWGGRRRSRQVLAAVAAAKSLLKSLGSGVACKRATATAH